MYAYDLCFITDFITFLYKQISICDLCFITNYGAQLRNYSSNVLQNIILMVVKHKITIETISAGK